MSKIFHISDLEEKVRRGFEDTNGEKIRRRFAEDTNGYIRI